MDHAPRPTVATDVPSLVALRGERDAPRSVKSPRGRGDGAPASEPPPDGGDAPAPASKRAGVSPRDALPASPDVPPAPPAPASFLGRLRFASGRVGAAVSGAARGVARVVRRAVAVPAVPARAEGAARAAPLAAPLAALPDDAPDADNYGEFFADEAAGLDAAAADAAPVDWYVARTEPAAMRRLLDFARSAHAAAPDLAPVPALDADVLSWVGWLAALLLSSAAMLYVVSLLPAWWQPKAAAMMRADVGAVQHVSGLAELSAAEIAKIDPRELISAAKRDGTVEHAAPAALGRGVLFACDEPPAGLRGGMLGGAAAAVLLRGAALFAWLWNLRNAVAVPVPLIRVIFAPVFLGLVLLQMGLPGLALLFFARGVVPIGGGAFRVAWGQAVAARGFYGGHWAVIFFVGRFGKVCIILIFWIAFCGYECAGFPAERFLVPAHPYSAAGAARSRIRISWDGFVYVAGQYCEWALAAFAAAFGGATELPVADGRLVPVNSMALAAVGGYAGLNAHVAAHGGGEAGLAAAGAAYSQFQSGAGASEGAPRAPRHSAPLQDMRARGGVARRFSARACEPL